MKRVMIIGQPGAGKSWLAREMGRRTGLPVYHMDHIHWQAGWVERSQDEKLRLAREVHAQEEWIFEGGHSRSWDERVARADTCIWLDFPLWFRFGCVIYRTLKTYGQDRPDMTAGCPERFSGEFMKWIWDTRQSGRRKPAAIFASPDTHLTRICLKTRADVARYLQGIPGSVAPQGHAAASPI